MSRATTRANAQKLFGAVPDHIREDLVEAAIWARKTLTDKEGSGHEFHLTADKEGFLYCSFAKPEWSGDHCGQAMETASEAIVMSVCEYLGGL